MDKSEKFVVFLESLKTPETNAQIDGVIAGFKLLESEGELETDVMGQSIVRIPITYEIVTEESAEEGVFADHGFEDEEGDEVVVDTEEGETIPQAVANYLKNKGAIHPSEDPGPARWWTTEGDIDYTTGETKSLGYHLDALSEADRLAVYELMTGRKVDSQGMPETIEGDVQPTEEISPESLDEFTLAYIASILWTEEENLNEEGIADPSINDIAPETLKSIVNDCINFRDLAGELLSDWSPEQAGHDFWLTRNGHGAGFWDRGLGDENIRNELTQISETFGDCNVYVGDDGKIYAS